MGNNEIKISLLADDMTLLLQDLTSGKNVLNTLAYFHKCFSLKINLDKSNTKYIASLRDDDYFLHGLSWIKTPFKTLGISIVNNSDMNYKFSTKNCHLEINPKYLETKKFIHRRKNHHFKYSCFTTSNLCIM